ncbi:MAG: cation:proton antiporter [Muribaculaceae bacterium]|nr:cation:proton antiporter [Muribaculaceae bacterium]
MESLITDLAFILLLGAVVTVVFKWLKQPVVLGYIVAGFLASPNFTPIPSVTTEANIDFWAELGIIVLLFSLGVEFSFKKLMNVGGSAIVTVIIIITGMMMSGFLVGHFLGFSSINCLFLGGMLSMSSTTIIIKAFTDMGLRQKKFASIVFGVLIVEDLFAVLLMVVLSSIAVNKSVEGSELLLSVSKLVFFLVIWFVVGVYVLPSVLNRVRVFLNNETLLVVSMGLCLGMAVFSVACGFSLALGAFVMGSILAGTSYAERIERVTMPVKDLFGSVFFISVGMMVQPTVVVEYWGPILLLSGVVIVGMIVFASFGLIVTGQSLKVAIQSGFSLTQIGEFAFIIASLGQSLGVLDATIYPIVVAVSVITTFTTPYFIKMAEPFYRLLDKMLPNRLHSLLERFHKEAETQQGGSNTTRKMWGSLIKRYAWRMMLFSIIIIAISLVSSQYFTPWLAKMIPSVGKLLGVLITLAFIAPFLMALSLPVSKKGERELLAASGGNHGEVPLVVMSVVRVLIGLGLVISFITSVYGLAVGIVAGIVFIVLILMVFSRQVMNGMRNIEAKFINNLNERELRRSGKNNSLVSDLHLAYMHVGCNAPFVGERLIDSGLQKDYGVNVVNIQRGQQFIPVPAGDARLFPGDVVGVVGTDAQLEALLPVMEHEEHSEGGADARDFELRSVSLSGTSPLLGKTIEQIDVRRRYQAFILAIERGGETITNVIKEPLEEGDRLWMVGSRGILDAIS